MLSPKDMRWGPLIPIEMARMANPSMTASIQHAKWRHKASIHTGPAMNAISIEGTPFSFFPTEGQEPIWSYASGFTADPLGEAIWPSLLTTVESTLSTAPFSFNPMASSDVPIDLSLKSEWTSRQRTVGFGFAWLRSRMPTIESIQYAQHPSEPGIS